MSREKASNYINIAHKAGYVIIGSDKLGQYKQKLYLILIDENAGNYSQKIAKRFEQNGIKVMAVNDLQSLSNIKSCKICGIKNKNLSDIIINELNL